MFGFRKKTLIATIGAVVLPLLALVYLSSIPGKKSAAIVVLQGAIVIGGVILFGILLARLIEQLNARRVARWIESDEGQEWLAALPEAEREAFLERFESFR